MAATDNCDGSRLECSTDSADLSTLSGISAATTFSDLEESSISSHKHKLAAKKWTRKEKQKQKNVEKRRKKNKISKDDFYGKIIEFKVWLSDKKHVKFDELEPKQQKEYFKKFVKKWNAKKLEKRYYRGLDILWAPGTPDNSWILPHTVEMTPGSIDEKVLEQKYSRANVSLVSGLGTFGKNSGAKMLRELRNMGNVQETSNDPDPSKKKTCNLETLFVPPSHSPKGNLLSDTDEDWPDPPSPFTGNDLSEDDSAKFTVQRIIDPTAALPLPPVPQSLPPVPQSLPLVPQSLPLVPLSLHPVPQSLPPVPLSLQVGANVNKSQTDLQHHTNKLIKVNIPIVKPKIFSKPPSIGAKPRPLSCIGSLLPNKPIPPIRPTSSDCVPSRSQSCMDTINDWEASRKRFHTDSQAKNIPPLPPKRTVSLENFPQAISNSDQIMNGENYAVENPQSECNPVFDQTQGFDNIRRTSISQVEYTSNKNVSNNEKNMNFEESMITNEKLEEKIVSSKRTLSQCEEMPGCMQEMPGCMQEDATSSRPRLTSCEPEKKVLRKDSFAVRIANASHAVFQTLSSARRSVRPGERTPVRINSTPVVATATPISLTPGGEYGNDKLQLTPGKSSIASQL